MADLRLSEKASRDLDDIADYTFETFGEHQADRYSREMLEIFTLLAERPRMGRQADELRDGLGAYPHLAHVIYYSITATGVLIVGVLHAAPDSSRHL